jgi:hypothetical protein
MAKTIDCAAAWRPRDFEASGRWLRVVSAEEAADLGAAVDALKASGKTLLDVTRRDVELGRFARVVEETRVEVESGLGVCVLRGLPTAGRSPEDNRLMIWAIGAHLGVARPQGKQSQMISDVRDAGGVYRSNSGRGYNTNAELDFHSDGSDVVGLLCLNTARSGGLSRMASAVSIHNAMLQSRPDLVEALYGPFPHSRQKEEAANEAPWYLAPVFGERDGLFACRYIRNHIRSSQALEAAPRLTALQHEALDMIQTLAESGDFAFDLWLRPGDLQLLNNHLMLHARTQYEDFEEPAQKRHMLRLWLSTRQARPLPEGFRAVYKAVESNTVRGGFQGQAITQELIAYQARAAADLGMTDTPYLPAA